MKDKIKYVVVAASAILLILFMYLNKEKFALNNINSENNIIDEVHNNISEEEKNNIISDASILIEEKIIGLYIYFDKSYENINDMNNQDKLWMAYWYLKDDKNGKNLEDYTSDEILAEMREIFGSRFIINFEDIKGYNNTLMYKYNESIKKFEYVGGGFGLSLLELIRNDLVSFDIKDNKYLITYKPLFVYSFLDLGDIDILDIKHNKLLSYDFKDYDEEIVISNEEYNNIKDNITSVTYVLEKENNHLVLTGIKLDDK